jgi:uncharacterized protein (DUF924 family)
MQSATTALWAAASIPKRAQDVLNFWFPPGATSQQEFALWYGGGAELDNKILREFGSDVEAAAAGSLDQWKSGGQWSCLALVILLDQFTLNIYRDQPKSFQLNALAEPVANYALEQKYDVAVPPKHRQFFYLPFMHSESLDSQNRSVKLYEALQKDGVDALGFAILHRDIVAKHGRFPGRNKVLGRTSNAAELQYLAEGGEF